MVTSPPLRRVYVLRCLSLCWWRARHGYIDGRWMNRKIDDDNDEEVDDNNDEEVDDGRGWLSVVNKLTGVSTLCVADRRRRRRCLLCGIK